jgi:hypothetical protein
MRPGLQLHQLQLWSPENTQEDLDNPELAYETDIQKEYTSD